MNFLKALFGSSDVNPEEEKKNADARRFDLMKYDGVKAMKIGRLEYAVRCFQEALQMQDDLEIHDYLSRVYVQLGQNDEAVAELQLLMDAQPDNKSLPLQAAHLASLMQNFDLMQQCCERSLAIDENNSRAHYAYARACLGKGDKIGAVARLTRCIALEENFGDAYLLRGQTLLGMGELNGAAYDTHWLLIHNAINEDVLLLAARVEALRGNTDNSMKLYDGVIEMNPFQIDAYRERGKLRFDKGDKEGAEEDMKKVLELNPEEMANVSGDYQAEGIEQKVKRAYSAMNPFGI